MLVYAMGVAKSWMYWPLIAGVVFLWKYKKAKRRFEEQHPGQVAMAWPIDEQVRVSVGIVNLILVGSSANEFAVVLHFVWRGCCDVSTASDLPLRYGGMHASREVRILFECEDLLL